MDQYHRSQNEICQVILLLLRDRVRFSIEPPTHNFIVKITVFFLKSMLIRSVEMSNF